MKNAIPKEYNQNYKWESVEKHGIRVGRVGRMIENDVGEQKSLVGPRNTSFKRTKSIKHFPY